MTKNILITGGTGLVGTRLTEKLLERGYKVSYLSRHAGEGRIKKYRWDLKTGYLDESAIKEADGIVHLAGAGVFDKRWTPEYKKEIMDSRIDSTSLLAEKLASVSHHVKSVICASAIGLYGFDTGDAWQLESAPTGEGFLAEVTGQWEKAIAKIEATAIRTVKLRIGIVLSKTGGALKEMGTPVKYFIGSPFGSGKQYVSWIHIDDLCEQFIYALENDQMIGAYNAVAPDPVTNQTLIKEIAHTLKRPLWVPNVPRFALKLVVGSEAADVLLGGNRVSSKKIADQGFKFTYPGLRLALEQLLQNHK
jgi:uncharacterized protein (TIGR01777 family)